VLASLFLVVKRKGEKLAGESDWSFPQGERKQGESMRDAVTRTLESFVGTGAQISFVGYSPMVSRLSHACFRAASLARWCSGSRVRWARALARVWGLAEGDKLAGGAVQQSSGRCRRAGLLVAVCGTRHMCWSSCSSQRE